MTYFETIVGLEQFSCVLSMLGSCLVALTWAYPFENRLKHGRILLLWLSVVDLISSAVYFVQTLEFPQNEVFCKSMALLGIFFPVASFLWTDFIAFYLYQAVVNRTNQMEWKSLLRIFHIIAWSLSGLIIIFVAVFDHAGRALSDDNNDDDIATSNTGGWCWIKGSSSTDRLTWELIGGKIVEWLSCFLILPYLYTSVSCKLKHIDKQASSTPPLNTNIRATSVFRESREPLLRQKEQPQMNNEVSSSAVSGTNRTSLTAPPSQLNTSTSGSVSNTVTPAKTINISSMPNQTPTSIDTTTPAGHNNSSANKNPVSNPLNRTGSTYSSIFSNGAGNTHSRYLDDSYNLENPDFAENSPNRPKYACEESDTGNMFSDAGDDFRDSSQISETDLPLSSANNSHTITDSSSQATSPRGHTPGRQNKGEKKSRGWFRFPLIHAAIQARNRTNSDSTSAGSGRGTKGFFTKFYVKLGALPLVFFFIRFWGSVRVVLLASGFKNTEVLRFFAVMQAFFDPSQGFFNAILFVFLNKEDRTNLLISVAMLCRAVGHYIPCCVRLSTLFASPQTILKYTKSAANATRLNGVVANTGTLTTANVNDLTQSLGARSNTSGSFGDLSLSDFECEEGDRISDFSFESGMESLR